MKDTEADLFGNPVDRVETVSEFTRRVKTLLEGGILPCWVKGEVSNLRAQASGHAYFSLKDAGAQLAAVLFRGDAARQKVALKDGMQVAVYGEVSVYEVRGQYQLIVRAVVEEGLGKLQREFEALKRKLAEEGLFAAERKRPGERRVRPRSEPVVAIATVKCVVAITAVGVVLSGAAEYDVIAVAAGNDVVTVAPGDDVISAKAVDCVLSAKAEDAVSACCAIDHVVVAGADDYTVPAAIVEASRVHHRDRMSLNQSRPGHCTFLRLQPPRHCRTMPPEPRSQRRR